MRYISNTNEYYISKYRFLELKNFCLQYNEKKQEIAELAVFYRLTSGNGYSESGVADTTGRIVTRVAELSSQLELIEQTAAETDSELAPYILRNVTQGIPFDCLGAPCSKNTYSNRRKKFFWLLSMKR